MRSAGAANVYGVTLENSIGYTTAIAQVTRESGEFTAPFISNNKCVSFKLLETPKAI